MPTVLKSLDKWKEFLSDRVSHAQKTGMSEETIANLAFQIGDFLANKIDPENKAERVLKELWDVGTEEERKTMARLMVKWVGQSS